VCVCVGLVCVCIGLLCVYIGQCQHACAGVGVGKRERHRVRLCVRNVRNLGFRAEGLKIRV